jgi:hypothetical protein
LSVLAPLALRDGLAGSTTRNAAPVRMNEIRDGIGRSCVP